ncbi:MAG: peptide-methionine (S)-S-oxide reductase MsrA [Candidatus Eremiobacteraeota bacterium]|nr:peptide-methionine (S)-S-oxide reductase MsrA [Candidatus Eremiobacteraeota bacterium]
MRTNIRSLFVSAAVAAQVLAFSSLTTPARAPAAPAASTAPQPESAQKVVFAGGCFWGIEAVFESLKGVSSAVSGYAGGSAATAHYEIVSTGTTGHAESVEVTYDPAQISYEQLLEVFFLVAHDPTELNRQGPDEGTQYRSVVFYTTDEQKRETEAFIAQLTKRKAYGAPIVTQVVPLVAFYPAEAYHQHFAARNPYYPYIVINDEPKLVHLRQQFPNLVKGGPKAS